MTRIGRVSREDVILAYHHALRDAVGRYDASVARLRTRMHHAGDGHASDAWTLRGDAWRLYRELMGEWTDGPARRYPTQEARD